MDGELDVAKACCRRVLRPLLHATWDRRSLPLVDSAFACAAFGVVDAADALRVLLGRTVVQGLSRSAIVVGPAHQARIAMIHALNLVDQGLGGSPSSYAVVHLSGLLHTNDVTYPTPYARYAHLTRTAGDRIEDAVEAVAYRVRRRRVRRRHVVVQGEHGVRAEGAA